MSDLSMGSGRAEHRADDEVTVAERQALPDEVHGELAAVAGEVGQGR